MNALHIESSPLLNVIQKACETLVVHNHAEMATIYNAAERQLLSIESAQASEIIDHIINIRNNQEG